MASCKGVKPKPYSSARGGAWRNPKLTGGPYVCEQCHLDACGGNDATLTIHTAIRPHCGVALVLIYPCGKAWNSPQVRGLTPLSLALDDSRSVLAVKGPLRRFAPWTAPDRSGETRCL